MYDATTIHNNNNSPDEVAVCNLASINLSAMVTDGVFDFQRLYTIAKVVCKNLNKVIGKYNIQHDVLLLNIYISTAACFVLLSDASNTLTSVVACAVTTTPKNAK
jgi:Ribonucleotide reductase, barrel domain